MKQIYIIGIVLFCLLLLFTVILPLSIKWPFSFSKHNTPPASDKCSGHGVFSNGKCICDKGWSGDKCDNNKCIPKCYDGKRKCGPDGCGGSCGECKEGKCSPDGQCVSCKSDIDCNSGSDTNNKCDKSTLTCKCSVQWSGSNCQECTDKNPSCKKTGICNYYEIDDKSKPVEFSWKQKFDCVYGSTKIDQNICPGSSDKYNCSWVEQCPKNPGDINCITPGRQFRFKNNDNHSRTIGTFDFVKGYTHCANKCKQTKDCQYWEYDDSIDFCVLYDKNAEVECGVNNDNIISYDIVNKKDPSQYEACTDICVNLPLCPMGSNAPLSSGGRTCYEGAIDQPGKPVCCLNNNDTSNPDYIKCKNQNLPDCDSDFYLYTYSCDNVKGGPASIYEMPDDTSGFCKDKKAGDSCVVDNEKGKKFTGFCYMDDDQNSPSYKKLRCRSEKICIGDGPVGQCCLYADKNGGKHPCM